MENKEKALLLILTVLLIYYVPGGDNGNSESDGAETHCDVLKYLNDSKSVNAVVGTNITLPCETSLNISNLDDVFVLWKKYGTEKEIYKLREGKHDYENKNITPPSELHLKKGNGSIVLSGVTKSDAGEYCCCFDLNGIITCIKVALAVDKHSPDSSRRDGDPTAEPTGLIGGITGGVLGGLGGLVLVAVAVFFIVKKCRKDQQQENQQELNDGESEEQQRLREVQSTT